MEEFEIGQVFEGCYPPKAAQWCNKNKAHIVDITPEGESKSIYRIDANKPPSVEAVKKVYENAVQAHLDATAQTRGYDNTYPKSDGRKEVRRQEDGRTATDPP